MTNTTSSRPVRRRLNLAAWTKPLIVLLFTILWLLMLVARSRFAGGEAELDASWVMGLASTFQEGAISGRDFHFNYGPLAQLMAAFGAWLTNGTAFDAYPLISLVFCFASALAVAAVILLIDRLNWKHAIVIYSSIALTSLLFEITSFRVVMIVVLGALLYRMTTASSFARQTGWAASAGLFCFAEQVVTPELAAYGLFTIVVVSAGYSFRSGMWLTAGKLLGVCLTVFLLCNLTISLMFKLTSADYGSLFDYQRYALDMMRGYVNGMGAPWEMPPWRTLGMFAVTAFAVYGTVSIWRHDSSRDAYLFLALMSGSLISLKSAAVRSDLGHITHSFKPLVLAFLILGQGFLMRREATTFLRRYFRQAGWCAAFVVLLIAWPWTGLYAVMDLGRVLRGELSSTSVLEYLSSRRIPAESILPAELTAAAAGRDATPMLNFPYQNYIGILLKRPTLAPVLQSFAATTQGLERFYVDRLNRQLESGFDVTYTLDEAGGWLIDGMQDISRTPLIFDYLYRNFQVQPDQQNDAGIYLLQRRREPRVVNFQNLMTQSSGVVPSSGRLQLAQPVNCGLVALDVEMTYPLVMALGRPSPIQITLKNGEETVRVAVFKPVQPNRVFRTYVSLIHPTEFYEVFGSSPIAVRTWDSLSYAPLPSDWIGILPSRVNISNLQCVNPDTFVPDKRPVRPTETFPETKDFLDGPVRAGYFVVTPESKKAPEVFVRMALLSGKRSSLTAPVGPPVTRASFSVGMSLWDTVGMAIANPGEKGNAVSIRITNADGHDEGSTTLKLAPGHQTSMLLSEAVPGISSEPRPVTVTLQGQKPFSLFALQFGGAKVLRIPLEGTKVAPGPPVFPQFAIHGGWWSEIILFNPTDEVSSGRVDLFAPDRNPLTIRINGAENHTFGYSIPPGETVRLSPGVSRE